MFNRRTQIVIGIAILIISAAFLLVGVYFANLQGILFQNGANSLQLFANNIAAIKDALYLAPSSMSITLSGNNSLCTWNPSIDAYDCSGGSKIYNISYASGPTLDAGTSMFSVALCFMVSYGPPGSSEEKGGAEATTTVAEETSTLYTSEEAAQGLNSLFERANREIPYTEENLQGFRTMFTQAEASIPYSEENLQGFRTMFEQADAEEAASEAPLAVNLPTSEAELENSFASQLGQYAKAFIKNKYIIRFLSNTIVPAAIFWFGADLPTIVNYANSGYSVAGHAISGFSSSVAATYNQITALYDPGPVQFGEEAANLQWQQYVGFINSAGNLNGLSPTSLQAYNQIQTAVGEAQLQQNVATELAQVAAVSSNNSYSTPTGGVSVPASVSSSNGFVNTNVAFNGAGDPVLTFGSFLAQKAFLVYGETATCIGSMPQGISVNTALTDAATIYGQASTLANIYNIANVITEMGTYFVGYGGEAYVNGQSSGLPTLAGSPIISDMSDLCGIATSNAEPGQSLKTLIFPAGNGNLRFSISSGLYNTVCSGNNPLYPKTFSAFANQILSAPNGTNISMYLPSEYALGLSNSSKSSNLCLFNVILDAEGSPINVVQPLYQSHQYGSQGGQFSNNLLSNYITEFGTPSQCLNLNNVTNGKENLIFTEEGANGFNVSKNVDVNAFFLNNQSEIGFSIPPNIYPNTLTINPNENPTFQASSNFIGGPATEFITKTGIDFPVAQLISKYTGTSSLANAIRAVSNGLESSGNNALIGDIIDAIIGDIGNDNLSYYPTDYTNVTFEVVKTTKNGITNINLVFKSNDLIFGVYPNNPSQAGGSYQAIKAAENKLSNQGGGAG